MSLPNTTLFDYSAQKTEPPQKKTEKRLPAKPLSVTELTLQVKANIESGFNPVWVVGQISGLKRHTSGHIYLSLKDDGAVLSAVVWKSSVSRIRFNLKDGLEVICKGNLDVYPPQGKYQLVITELEPKGIGSLELAFRQLHTKLSAEGLFDAERKKPLPEDIRRIAVITSPTGAAVQDFLRILGRRTQLIDVLLVPVHVQGDEAAREIAQAVQKINRFADTQKIDCIAVIRGGGSIEDLWAFNEEILVRAVALSDLPVVSGVGHEVDTTLCDYAADIRTATPSEAAERLSQEDAERRRKLLQCRQQLGGQLLRKLKTCQEKFRYIANHSVLLHPERLIEHRQRQVDTYEDRFNAVIDRQLETAGEKIRKAAAELEALSPLAVLKRGYTLTETVAGSRVKSVADVRRNDKLITKVADGVITSQVTD
ncbi:exodeoxyribonuclease 7 large subunit [Planctomycetales bacterium]|nr:exodeoxyribonuclease 7 large subunit [Planctomycetales bacterium]